LSRGRAAPLSASARADRNGWSPPSRFEHLEHCEPARGQGLGALAAPAIDNTKFGSGGQRVEKPRLDRVPIALKDLFETEGDVATNGSATRLGVKGSVSASVVQRLRAAGMVILGKAQIVEFAYGGWSINPHFGTPRDPVVASRIHAEGGVVQAEARIPGVVVEALEAGGLRVEHRPYSYDPSFSRAQCAVVEGEGWRAGSDPRTGSGGFAFV
jgi:hypothetical protein